MTQTDVPKLFAGCSALAAFAIAIIAGLAADNPIDTILVRAVVSMAACFFLGSLLGLAAEAAVREATRPRKAPGPTGAAPSFEPVPATPKI